MPRRRSHGFARVLLAFLLLSRLPAVLAQPAVLTIDLFGKVYDVYAIPGVPKTKALNNRIAYHDAIDGTVEVASIVADFDESFYKQGAVYGTHSGRSYVHIDYDTHPEKACSVEDISDAGVVIGWDRSSPPRAFIWTGATQLQYLDALYPAVKALSDQRFSVDSPPYGSRGLRINRNGDMLIQSAPVPGDPKSLGYYLVTTNGSVSVLDVSETQLIDLNNHGQIPPPGAQYTLNVVLNDVGDFAGVKFDAGETNLQPGKVSTTLNGSLLADSHGTYPTSINNSGWVGAQPGIIWTDDGKRTDLRQVLAQQDPNHKLPGFYPSGTNGQFDVFVNDAGDIVMGGAYFLEPICPEISIGAGGGAGVEIIGGRFAVRVGGRFKATANLSNDGKVPVHNVTVDLYPPTDLLRVVSGPNPPLPSSLAAHQTASAEYEFEVLRPGTYPGGFAMHALSYCGPIDAQAVSAHLTFVQPSIAASVEVDTTTVGLQDSLEVRVKAVNVSTQLLTNIKLVSPLAVAGDGGVALDAGPSPALVASLDVGQSVFFTNRYVATNLGTVTFSGKVQGFAGAQLVDTPVVYSPEVRIGGAADLLVKQASDPDSAYVLNDRYFDLPSDYQLVTAQVQTNKPGVFSVRIDNDSKATRTLRLSATVTNGAHWTTVFKVGNQDVTAAVLGPGGLGFPNVESNGVRYVTVTTSLAPTATEQEDQRVTLTVSADDLPGRVLDLAQLRSLRATVPVITYLAKLRRDGLTDESVEAGRSDIDAPLVPVTNPFILSGQPLISAGLVADGVTPLLIALNADPKLLKGIRDGRAFRVVPTLLEGDLLGAGLLQRLRVLQGSSWVATNEFTLDGEHPDGYAYLMPILADDVRVSLISKEVKVSLKILESESGVEVGSKVFAIRQPPLFLIHGYNTAGNWGEGAMNILGLSREAGTFLQVLHYGQEKFQPANGLSKTAGTDLVNTYYTLDDLAPIALETYNQAKLKLDPFWAFTRHDVAAHSQGGLLTRMLCSQNANQWVPQPFRNRENFYRGRFHRVVTIGSPHNGTRLLRYLLALLRSFDNIPQGSVGNLTDGLQVLPQAVGLLMVRSGTAQDKFDPFGPQIRQLNDPSPAAPWFPDPAARFHLVRTAVDHGNAPLPGAASPGELAMGLVDLNQPVIPHGSDGVVDWDSMVAEAPGGSAPANSFTLPVSLLISHSGPTALFGSDVGQTDSADVARHVHAALLQDSTNPDPKAFGPFALPPLLGNLIRDSIDDWARNVRLVDLVISNLTSLGPQPADLGAGTYQVHLNAPAGVALTQPLAWTAEVYGPQGVSLEGVVVEPVAGAPGDARIIVDPGVFGDIVLHASFRGANGTNYFSRPLHLLSRERPGNPPIGLVVEPDDRTLPVGAEFGVQLGLRYADGSMRMAFAEPKDLVVTSSPAGIVDVSRVTRWQVVGVGTASVTLHYNGWTAIVSVTGALPDQPYRVPLTITPVASDQVQLQWPSYAPGVLESADSGVDGNWTELFLPSTIVGDQRSVILPSTNRAGFFRVQP